MIAPIRLARLSALVPISDDQGRPSPIFMRYFNGVLDSVEKAFGGIIDSINQAQAAQSQADTATSDAATAQGSADAAQTTADAKLSKTQADGYYVTRDSTPAWDAPTGTAERTTFATYTAPTLSTPPTQDELQALAQAAQDASRRLGALVSDLLGADVVTNDPA